MLSLLPGSEQRVLGSQTDGSSPDWLLGCVRCEQAAQTSPDENGHTVHETETIETVSEPAYCEDEPWLDYKKETYTFALLCPVFHGCGRLAAFSYYLSAPENEEAIRGEQANIPG
jgi:hypothetical protein